MESMQDLKSRAMAWPFAWGEQARGLIRDAHFDLMMCQRRHLRCVVDDLRIALLSLEADMLESEKNGVLDAKNQT